MGNGFSPKEAATVCSTLTNRIGIKGIGKGTESRAKAFNTNPETDTRESLETE